MTGPDRTAPPPGRSRAAARSLAPQLVSADAAERSITVDQTNTSVVVGEAVVVKWLTPPVPHPDETVALLRHLDAAGFAEMPRFFGPFIDPQRPDVVQAMVGTGTSTS
jgi:hypothetical protein